MNRDKRVSTGRQNREVMMDIGEINLSPGSDPANPHKCKWNTITSQMLLDEGEPAKCDTFGSEPDIIDLYTY